MTRRVLVLAAMLAAAATAAPALAGPATPAPTASVATYVQGVQLPASPVSAAWSHVHAGCSGRLDVTGNSASGTTTVVTGRFTSRTFVPHRAQVLSIGFARQRQDLVALDNESLQVSVRLRIDASWTPWFSFGVGGMPPQPFLVSYADGGGMRLIQTGKLPKHPPHMQAQFRVVEKLTETGSADDSFGVGIGC